LAAASGSETANRQALLAVAPQEEEERDPIAFRGPVALLPVELDVTVPVREFRVRHLLALAPGQLIESQWGNGEDVPLASGDVQLAWSEFEVIDAQLAVRVTRLA
jgi:flagellar motor switch/type III secretory pathway protein FliN